MEADMELQARSPVDVGRLITGALVMLVGGLCWLYQTEHFSLSQLAAFWPLALIGVGLCDLVERRLEPIGGRSGWGWLLAGVVLLVGNHVVPERHTLEIWFGVFPVKFSWPLLLIIAGSYVAWRERFAPQEGR